MASKSDKYLSSLTAEELNKKVWRINFDGINRSFAIKDVLFHTFIEEVHHRDEIIAILWQLNIQPPDMGWPSVMNKSDPPWQLR